MGQHVTIGVPIYRGERWLRETLGCIQAQTHRDFGVLMSLDGPNPLCEAICDEFLADSRFRLVIQPERLGWNGNISWLMRHAEGDYWYFHQQDDLTSETYVETLLAHAQAHPEAALVCCELVPFGRIEGRMEQPASVLGASPFMRLLTFLHEQFPAFAFRGLTRMDAVRYAGGLLSNAFVSFGTDICWIAAVALSGEIHHLPLPLYRKRYHEANTESAFWAMPRDSRLDAWAIHCAQMLRTALRVETTAQGLRLLWLAAVERLTSPSAAGHFLPVADLTPAEHERLFTGFLGHARALAEPDVSTLLDASWPEIEGWSRGFFHVPGDAPIEIVAFGPNPVRCGEPFEVQPDGSSALWVRTARRPAPGWRIRLGGATLPTVVRNTVLTTKVPPELTSAPGGLELVIVASDGTPRSAPVTFDVIPSS
jgi:GT2 family glycosyltransferase